MPLRFPITVYLGEFGVVYKARLQRHRDGAAELVAVKTLKGLTLIICSVDTFKFDSSMTFCHHFGITISSAAIRSLHSK